MERGLGGGGAALLPGGDHPGRHSRRTSTTASRRRFALFVTGSVSAAEDCGARRQRRLRRHAVSWDPSCRPSSPPLRRGWSSRWTTASSPFIAEPIFWVLEHIEKFVGNWGWSILILTVLIKAAHLQAQRDQRPFHGEDAPRATAHQGSCRSATRTTARRLSQAMMELYKKEKINPASGCLPDR